MADALALSSTFTGVVRSVNDKGLKLEGHDDWLNFSKFAAGIVAPERGDTVSVTLDKAGFVRSVAVVGGPLPVAGGSDAPVTAPSSGASRDRTITRLAVLKAAAEFAAGRTQLKSGEVLKIAESWERWVYRSDDPAADLEEAF